MACWKKNRPIIGGHPVLYPWAASERLKYCDAKLGVILEKQDKTNCWDFVEWSQHINNKESTLTMTSTKYGLDLKPVEILI